MANKVLQQHLDFPVQDTFLYEFSHTPVAHAPDWAGIFGEAKLSCGARGFLLKMDRSNETLCASCHKPLASVQAGTVGACHAAELGFVWLGGDGAGLRRTP